MLKSAGVSEEDRKIAMDGHEFASISINPIDFITFDDRFLRGCLSRPFVF